jgi:hypothetical protein
MRSRLGKGLAVVSILVCVSVNLVACAANDHGRYLPLSRLQFVGTRGCARFGARNPRFGRVMIHRSLR